MAKSPSVLGYALEGPGRPALAVQHQRFKLLGVDPEIPGSIFHDRIEVGSTRPRSQLVGRERLLESLKPGQTLVVAGPLCLTVSWKDALWFLPELASRGVTLIVASDIDVLSPEADHEELVQRIKTAQMVLISSRSRARSQKAKKTDAG